MKNTVMKLKVKEVRRETKSCFSVIFFKPKNFVFDPGECIDLRFLDMTYFKTFSLSSSPTEDDLVITVRDGISEVKNRLSTLKKNDVLQMKKYGNIFHLDIQYKSNFYAGGIGITPFRSMIKYAIDLVGSSQKRPTHFKTLFYLNRDGEFVFRDELETWRVLLPNFTIHYIVTGLQGRLTAKQIQKYTAFDDRTKHYIAGPSGMVDATMSILHNKLGVSELLIKTDSFDGYNKL